MGGKNSDIYLYEVSSNIRLLKKDKKPKWIPPGEEEWEPVPDSEMDSRGNENDHSKLGFLYWNERSSEGRKVGDGVYIWRIDFKFNDGHKEYRLLKTGVKLHK